MGNFVYHTNSGELEAPRQFAATEVEAPLSISISDQVDQPRVPSTDSTEAQIITTGVLVFAALCLTAASAMTKNRIRR